MKKEISPFWVRWMMVVSIWLLVMGFVLAFTPMMESLVGPAYYNTYFDGENRYAQLTDPELRFQEFLYGVSGAVMMAWSAVLLLLAHIPFRQGERWAWTAIALSTALWFIGDGYASISTGFALHALINVSLLVAILPPLAGTYRAFFGR